LAEVSAKEARLTDFLKEGAFREAVFIGCGSTHYLSLTAAAVFQALTGLRAQGVPSSELFLFARSRLTRGEATLLVPVSRSGETTETLRAVSVFKQNWGPHVLAITCDEASPLAADSSFVVVARGAKDKSIAQTRSFTSMLIAAQAVAGIASTRTDHLEQLRSLPRFGEKLLAREEALAQRLGEDHSLNKFFFLGSGPNYGLACEAMLKMKEMSLSYSEAFHFLEFRHGPMSMVDEETLVTGLLSDSAAEYEVAVLQQMKALGARILVFTEEEAPLGWEGADYLVCLASGLSEMARGPLYLPLLQLMAYYRAVDKGLDPDRPTNLEYAVKL
jgi:glucosamine--fructose-6-phosphate aminotransferase (isomerizing)